MQSFMAQIVTVYSMTDTFLLVKMSVHFRLVKKMGEILGFVSTRRSTHLGAKQCIRGWIRVVSVYHVNQNSKLGKPAENLP